MERSAAAGYTMVAVAAALFGVNASVVKVIEHTGFGAQRLTEVRSTGAFAGLALIVLATRPGAIAITRRELVLVAALGTGGLALVQWSYFFAIHRLPIGEALLIQFLAPLLVALWARFAFHERVRRRLWVALVLSLAGLVLIVELWRGKLDGVGIAVAGVACLSFAFYILLAERGTRGRDPISLLAWGFLFAALFWAVVQPWWSFPGDAFSGSTSLLGHISSLRGSHGVVPSTTLRSKPTSRRWRSAPRSPASPTTSRISGMAMPTRTVARIRCQGTRSRCAPLAMERSRTNRLIS